MRKRIIGVLVATLFLLSLAATGMAGKKGNPRKGKYLFRKTCRQCHIENSKSKTPAKPLSPNSKTQAQWKRAFKNHSKLKCSAEWDKLSKKDLNDIFSYLHAHAYDSPSPAKCQ
ncbi:MAG: cytochrome c [Deltaproteobacteria bacterium]|nr:MAG: cytochrome c [Deltaproteobacteria bacterium]